MQNFKPLRPLEIIPFCPIFASDSNFNPRNTHCIPACPVECGAHSSGVVKIFVFLNLEYRHKRETFFKGPMYLIRP